MFRRGELVYVKKSAAVRTPQPATSDKDTLKKLKTKKSSSYPVTKVSNHTLTVDISRIQNVVTIDRVVWQKQVRKHALEHTDALNQSW